MKHKTPQGNNENNGGIIQYFLHSPASDSVRRTDSCESIWDCLKWSRNLFYIQRHERHSDEITKIEIKYFSSKLECWMISRGFVINFDWASVFNLYILDLKKYICINRRILFIKRILHSLLLFNINIFFILKEGSGENIHELNRLT